MDTLESLLREWLDKWKQGSIDAPFDPSIISLADRTKDMLEQECGN